MAPPEAATRPLSRLTLAATLERHLNALRPDPPVVGEAWRPRALVRVDDEAVHIDFAVTQDTAAILSLGSEVDLELGSDHRAHAKIVAIDARVESATRNTWIRALLGSSEGMPQPGASVKVSVPVEKPRDVLVIPVSSLRRGPAGDHVFLIAAGPDGKTRAKMQRITSGSVIGDEVVVREGLKAGDRIAAAGSFKLFEGALIVVAPAGAASGATPQGK